MDKALNQNIIEKSKVVIEPEIFVGERKPQPLFTDIQFRSLLKHYQGIMLERHLKDLKSKT